MRSELPRWPPRRKLIFPESVKKLLKEPAGQLISGDPGRVADEIKRLIEAESPPLVISVGDYTSAMLRKHGVRVNLYVVDGRVERRRSTIFDPAGLEVVECVNDPGTISPEAASKLHNLLRRSGLRNVVLLVRGEEDLLTLAAIISAPEGSVIIYGQPGAGSVYVRVDRRLKDKALELVRLAESGE